MIDLSFTLYRFICDVSTFTSLFHEDQDRRGIPDSSSFHCCWTVVSRAKQSTINPAHAETDGRTSSTFFHSTNEGSDMALNFSSTRVHLQMDAESDVVSFYLKPSEYVGGDLPVIAKGTLDPAPYVDKPKKNYAIKLRDASGEVIGKLLFSLKALEKVDTHPPHPLESKSTAVPKRRASSERERSSDRGLPQPARTEAPPGAAAAAATAAPPPPPPPATPLADPPKAASVVLVSRKEPDPFSNFHHPPDLHHPQQHRSDAHVSTSTSPPQRAKTASRDVSPHRRDGGGAPAAPLAQQIDLVLERVFARPEHIDLDHPAPFVLDGAYYIKLRYSSSFTYYSADVVCSTPKEILLNAQRVCVTLLPSVTEKLRFSLWENNKQVAGFSLDPSKFKMPIGEWKEYTIPFRYFPTQQGASIDVTVRRSNIYLPASSEKETTPLVAAVAPAALPVAAPRLRSVERIVSPTRTREREEEQKPSPPPPPPPPPPPAAKAVVAVKREESPPVRTQSASPPRTGPGSGSCVVAPPALGGARGGVVGGEKWDRRSDALTNGDGGGGASAAPAAVAPHTVTAPPQAAPTAAAVAAPASAHHDVNAKGLPYRRFPSSTSSTLIPPDTLSAPLPLPPSSAAPLVDPNESSWSFSITQQTAPTSSTAPMATFSERRSALRREMSPLPRPVPVPTQEAKKVLIKVLSPLKVQERSISEDYLARRASPLRVPTPGVEVPTLTQHQAKRGCEVATALGAPPTPRTESSERQRATPLRSQLPRERDNSFLRHSSLPARGAAGADASASSISGRLGAKQGSMAKADDEDAHERYLAEVMARINKQQTQLTTKPVSRCIGLADEWHSWREERVNSRENSLIGMGSRSDSVRSREDSVASICSRRASSPLPTKSFADHATQKPYQPEYTAPVQRSSSRTGSLLRQRF